MKMRRVSVIIGHDVIGELQGPKALFYTPAYDEWLGFVLKAAAQRCMDFGGRNSGDYICIRTAEHELP